MTDEERPLDDAVSEPEADAEPEAGVPAEAIDPGLASEGSGEGGIDDDLREAADAVQADLDAIMAERDEYLALAQRVQADFENFRKRMLRQGAEERDRGTEQLVQKLLPVLDAFDSALSHDEAKTHVRPLYDALMDALEKEGLALLYPAGESFDPNHHEAVAHEPADGGGDEAQAGPVVSEVLRSGYLWRGRVLRPAMVKVRGG